MSEVRTAAKLICDEVLQGNSLEARRLRKTMIDATMGTKVPSLTMAIRWGVVNDALQALAAATPQPGDAE